MKDIPRLEAKDPGHGWLGFLVSLLFISAACFGCAPKSSEVTIVFDVSKGPAVETLKEAARQAEVEFIFSSDLVQNLQTPAIRGKYTPSDAFELMLADSSLAVVQHQRSGVYSIQKTTRH